jgi:riboflavin-specific deaminase-like protein
VPLFFRALVGLLVLCTSVGLLGGTVSATTADGARLLVRFARSTPGEQRDAAVRSVFGAVDGSIPELGVTRVRLITNNPAKIEALRRHGVAVMERVPVETTPNPANTRYLKTKAERMGHLLEPIPAPLHRPLVTVHYAQTIDGRIAARTGDAHWVSGEDSLRLAHELRAQHDAVLVGIGTVIADDPRLTVRLVDGRSPLRVIVDSKLRVPLESNVIADGAAKTLIATTPEASNEAATAIRARGAEVLRAHAAEDGSVDLRDLFKRLRARGVRSLLVEGGRGIITSALRDGLVDRLTVCIAPKVIGEGIEAVGDLGVDYLRQAMTFRRSRFITCGDDIVFYGEPRHDDEPAS